MSSPESSPESQQTWVMPAPPRLFNSSRIPDESFPLLVFGWPVPFKDRKKWTKRFKISTKLPEFTRLDHAWTTMRSLLPPTARQRTVVHYRNDGGRHVSCVYIGSNRSPQDLARAQNEQAILDAWKVLQTKDEPQWFMPVEQPYN